LYCQQRRRRINIYCICNKLHNRMAQIKIILSSWTLFIVFNFLKTQFHKLCLTVFRHVRT
jgi:hypothetical protein